MKTDIEIAQETKLIPINELAHSAGLADSEFEPYGRDKAKVTLDPSRQEKGRLILVTATSGMPAGSGKTTTSIALAQGLKRLGKNAALALREPSLGPVFGMKGGAAGGGYSQVLPMEAINLHFTGDLHAITAANNLLAALLDNARHQGQVQLREIYWRRVLDVNDRMLRNIITGLGGPANGIPTEAGFDITAASELMAVLCLANDLEDLRSRIDRIVLGLRPDGTAYTCGELGATGSLLALLFEAFKPNLVQSIEGNLAFVHGGPFANIAHGCKPNLEAVKRGIVNLDAHIANLKQFGPNIVVALNHFHTDTEAEIEVIRARCAELGVRFAVSDGFAKGGEGAEALAREVVAAAEDFHPLVHTYEADAPIVDKLNAIVTKVYGGDGVKLAPAALKDLKRIEELGFGKLPVCVAKTPFSLTADPKALGAPKGFTLPIERLILNAGSGFVVAMSGAIMRMPGLPKKPAAMSIDVQNGRITGLA